MTYRNSFSRVAGTALLAVLPVLTACSGNLSYEKPQEAAKQPSYGSTQTENAPKVKGVDDTTPLKLVAVYGRGYAHNREITTDVVGLNNCIKTAEVYARLHNSKNDTSKVTALCLPREGGHPVAEFECYGDSNNVYYCVRQPS